MDSYAVNQIGDHFWSIEDGRVRCFLLEGTERALLIDTGFGTGDLAQLVHSLAGKPLTLVTTHADMDHIGGNKAFGIASMHPSEFAHYHQSSCAGFPVSPLWEGDKIDLGGRRFEVLHIPGHTPGSIALLDRDNRMLIGGDSIQPGPIYMFGPARNFPAFIASMEKLCKLTDFIDTVYASHFALRVNPSIIPALLDGAKKVLSGEVQGVDPEATHTLYGRCKLYGVNEVSFWV